MKERESPPQLHPETCPYCTEEILVPYGYNIPCPKCGGAITVFDPEKRQQEQQKSPIEKGFRITSLDQSPGTIYQERGSRLQEGKTGSTLVEGGISYKDIGGLDETIVELDLTVNGAYKYPELWEHLGRKRTRGVLLSGPPGCGKSLLAQAVANESGRKVGLIQGAEIKGWRQGASEGNLISAYDSVKPNGILIIDEIDAIAGKREQMVNETNVSIVNTLCSILDGAKRQDNVTFIGTTNKPQMLDSALRRPGRLDIEVTIPLPDSHGRQQIFEIHTRGMPLGEDVDLETLSQQAHGFTGADIAGVCARLNQKLLKKAVSSLNEGIPQEEIIKSLFLAQQDISQVIAETVPSLLRESYIEVSTVTWEDVGGLENIKEELQRIIIWPLKYKDLVRQLNYRQPRGVLLYGPPGCGKTLLAKAMAGETEYNFLTVNGPALLSKWVGSTEEAIRDLFTKARQASPCVIFFDEIESVAPIRGTSTGNDVMDRAVSQLLSEIDGAQTLSDVFIIAATNRPDLVDPALLRPGRLDLQVEIPLPDKITRKEIFEIHLCGVPLKEVNLDHLAEITEGYSGAEIELSCQTAKKLLLEDCISRGADPFLTPEYLTKSVEEIAKRKYGARVRVPN